MNKCLIKQSKLTLLLIIFTLIIKQVSNASSPVTWTGNSYFVAGRITYTPTPMAGTYQQYVNINYGAALTAAPSRLVALGLVDFHYNLSDSNLYLYLINSLISQTGFQIYIESNALSYFMSPIRISMMTVDPAFTQPFSISYFTVTQGTGNFLTGPFNTTYLINFTASTNVTLNLDHDNAMLAFQHIFDLYNVSNGCFNLDIQFTVYNSSYYQVVVSTKCALQMNMFGFSRIIFDRTAIQDLGYCYFEYGQLNSINGNTSSLSLTFSVYIDGNFMLGMKSFHVDSLSAIQFLSNLGATTSISSSVVYKQLSFMYWSLKYRVCPGGTPYFEVYSQLCYDVCPNGTYLNSGANLCLLCNYTCQTCSSFNICTNCNASTHRYLNGSSCLPNPGYFDNNQTEAVPCSSVMPNCTQCNDEITCLNCSTGYYLSLSLTCQECPDIHCLSCIQVNSTVQCTLCASGYVVDPAFGSTTCIILICVDANCANCSGNFSYCLSCDPGYISLSGICVLEVCGDGTKTVSQQCDDNNTVDGDGCNADCTFGNNNNCSAATPLRNPITNLCTNTCPNRFFQNISTYDCEPCYYTCGTCSNSTQCDSCDASSHRFLNGTQCQPEHGYYDNSNLIADPCVSPCATCTSATNCITCVSNYYMDSNGTCQPCSIIANCIQCTLVSTVIQCILCSSSYMLDQSKTFCLFQQEQPQMQIQNPHLKRVALSMEVSSLIILFCSLFATKLVGLQLIGVFQLAFIILINQPQTNPYLIPLRDMIYVHGYNLDSRKTFKNVPSHIKAIHYSFSFLENINIMLSLLLFEFFVSIILVTFSLKFQYFKKISRIMIKQVFLTFFLFNSFNITFSAGLHFRYATPQNIHNYGLSTITAVFSLLLCGFTIVGSVLFSNKYYGEYKDKFKQNIVTRFYIPLSIIYRFVIGFGISYFNDYSYVTLVILALSILFLFYNIINLPYDQVYQNYRANVCHVTHIVIIIVSNYYSVMKSNLKTQVRNKIISPALIQICMLMICILISVVSLLYQFFKKKKVSNTFKEKVKWIRGGTPIKLQIETTEEVINCQSKLDSK